MDKCAGVKKANNFLKNLSMIVVVIVIILCNFYVIRVATIYGKSMEPTLHSKEWVLIWQLGYTPSQGDIIIIDKNNELSQNIVKRVIAVGGQTVRMEGTEIYVDGIILEEPYLVQVYDYPLMTVTVPENECFVMGDNRDFSTDSRNFGCIKNENVIGKVILKLFSLE